MDAYTPPRTIAAPRARGLSLIELMVGLVIGLLISLAAASSAQYFGAAQRQGIGVGSGGANAASTLAAVKDDVVNAGLGFFGNLAYMCNTLNLSVGAAAISNGAPFSPLQVTRVGTDDQLDVVYGDSVAAGAAVRVSSATTGAAQVSLKTLLPVAAGETVLLAGPTTAIPCVLRTVTQTPNVPTATVKQTLVFGPAGAMNQVAYPAAVYPQDSLVTLIGNLQWNRYALNGTDLQRTQVLTGNTVTLLRNVIAFRVEYGVGPASPGPAAAASSTGNRTGLTSPDPWVGPTDAGWAALSAANIDQVKAMRIGIVTRSAQREKENADTGLCEATRNLADIALWGNPVTPDVTDWQCYRYRTQIAVVPMRNIVYGM